MAAIVLMHLYAINSGIIRTALPNMDREAKEQYHVVIQAKDMGGHMGGLSGTTKVTITLTDVNDNPPKFPQSKIFFFHTKNSFIKLERCNIMKVFFFGIYLHNLSTQVHTPCPCQKQLFQEMKLDD